MTARLPDGEESVTVYKWLWERERGPVPRGWSLEHTCDTQAKARGGKTCKHRRCCEPAHLEPMPSGEHSSRTQHRQKVQPASRRDGETTAQQFEVARFAGVDRPAFERRTLALEDLVQMLSGFEVLEDKRRGRCWSPTRYREDAATRGNAGVEAVSCCDRTLPDLERLAGVFWSGHTTWSHQPEKPRWRVVIPLAWPVRASHWRDVWQRARAVLCPEADPSCKDPSRAYWLPSHPPGGAPQVFDHEGSLLDPASLAELPPEPERPELRRSPSATRLRKATRNDRQRGHRYMAVLIDNREATLPGGRNDALNHTAWTLGRRVAAGALDQREKTTASGRVVARACRAAGRRASRCTARATDRQRARRKSLPARLRGSSTRYA